MAAQQNLVPNGSFEIFDTCPQFPDQVYLAKGWYKPTIASPDYFNSCNINGFVSTPSNLYGNKIPFEGVAYAGFGVAFNSDYSEYISCKLNVSLKANYTYNINFYAALSAYSDYAINSVGVYFSNDSIYDNSFTGNALTSYTPQIISNTFITDTLNWTKINGMYKALGGERFITIGNFKPFILIDTIRSYGAIGFGSYYFIDSVGIYENKEDIIIPNVFTPNNDDINDVWIWHFSSLINCTIFNRWGNKIYTTSNSEIRWDGRTTSGVECSDGYYYYIIQTETENYKGFINLIR